LKGSTADGFYLVSVALSTLVRNAGRVRVYAGSNFSEHFQCFHWLLNDDRVFLSVWKM